MSFSPTQLAEFARGRLRELANPENAGPMAAYMKTTMPFYGVKNPERVPICRAIKKQFRPSTRKQYEAGVRALWRLSHREEKYTAIMFARQSDEFITIESFPLYERMIREGAWWDLVDDMAIKLVGRAQLKQRGKVRPVIERWIDDQDLWIRRTAILSQIQHREHTDEAQLFRHCLHRAEDKDFFVRKGIGWALREYSYTAPEAVRGFLLKNRERLSGLSFREGAKQLMRTGLIPKG